MSDEQSRETLQVGGKGVVFIFQGLAVSSQVVAKLMNNVLNGDAHKTGKQSLLDLTAKGKEVGKLELSGEGIPGFSGIARKHGINYSVLKDKGANKTYFYFQSQNTQQVKDAFSAYVKRQQKQKSKPSIRDKLEKARATASQQIRKSIPKQKEVSL